jgi:CRP-like cAMP-binding protein
VKGAFKFVACKEAEHDSFEKGAFIGEVNAMLSNEPLTTTIKAVTDSVIYVMLKDDLLVFLAKNPGLLVLFRDVKFFE